MRKTCAGALGLSLLCTNGCLEHIRTKVIAEAWSPDKSKVAQLVREFNDTANSSDEYFMMISKNLLDQGSRERALRRRDEPFVHVTRGKELKLQWVGADNLQVRCDSCGLQKVDVLNKPETSEGVHVAYVGFPIGTSLDK